MKDIFCLYSGIYAVIPTLKHQYFNVQKFKIWVQSILKVNQAVHTVRIVLYIGCPGPVIEMSTAHVDYI